MSQVKSDWWGKGERTTFFTEKAECWKEEGAGNGSCATCQPCFTSAAYPGYPTALCNHSWAASWGGPAVFILRGHSWPGISTDLAVPDSCERTKPCWRAFVPSLESLEMWSGFSLCFGLWVGAGKPFCFVALLSLDSHACCRSTGGGVDAIFGAAVPLPGHLLPLSPVQLHWARVTSLGSSNRNVLLPFLVLTDIYSIRHRRCSSALSEWSL